jgi:hypothetical protein
MNYYTISNFVLSLPYVKYLEAFAVMNDKNMYRTWQTSKSHFFSFAFIKCLFRIFITIFHLFIFYCIPFSDPDKWVSWDKTGYGAPTSVHAPVAHSMSNNFFNGALNVFVFGEDGSVHHIWQTTCDKVPNPWGWCTWSLWYKIGNAIPKTVESANPLSIGANIHNGIEVMSAPLTARFAS